MVVNLDIAIAGKSATFGFPEVKRGVSISAGGLPRFVRIVGHQKGKPFPALSFQQSDQIICSNGIRTDRQKHTFVRSAFAGNGQ